VRLKAGYWAGLVLAIVIAIALAGDGAKAAEADAPGDIEAAREDAVALTPALQQALAIRFRPHLYFDSAERWRPLDVETFMAERFPPDDPPPRHKVCDSVDGPCEFAVDIGDLRADAPVNPRPAIDIHGEAVNGRDYKPPALTACIEAPDVDQPISPTLPGGAVDCDAGSHSKMYVNVTLRGARYYLDYWWYYRYNDYGEPPLGSCTKKSCFDHEGDWEGVTVIVDAPATHFVGAVFAAHEARSRYPRRKLLLDGAHVRVYVAVGTHASYPRRCIRGCKEDFPGFGPHVIFPEGRHNGQAPWGNNEDDACGATCVALFPEIDPSPLHRPKDNTASWNAWPGTWGRKCKRVACIRSESPGTPGTQIRYLVPWNPKATGPDEVVNKTVLVTPPPD
jgi:hypothetical protein